MDYGEPEPSERKLVVKRHFPGSTHLIVLAGYTAFTVLITYPVAFKSWLFTIPGTPVDVQEVVWEMWWWKEAILRFRISPGWLPMIYYPTGTYSPFLLAYPYIFVMGISLVTLFGPNFAYNVLFMASFILTAYSAYLLCLYLLGDHWSAFLGGVLYGFSPHLLVHATGQLGYINMQWFPLLAIFFLKLWKRPSLAHALLFGVFLGLSLLTHLTHIPSVLLLLIGLALYAWATDRGAILYPAFLKHLTLGTALAALMATPFLVEFALDALRKTPYVYQGGTVEFSVDLLSYFLPSPYHPLVQSSEQLRQVIWDIAVNSSHGEMTYLGYTGLLLAAIGLWQGGRMARAWLWMGVAAAILSLGPLLKVGGGLYQYQIERWQSYIVLPYALVNSIPLLSVNRTPSRMALLAFLAEAVLASYGLRALLTRIPAIRRRGPVMLSLLVLLISLVVTYERVFAFPFWHFDVTPSPFFLQIADQDPPKAVLEITAIKSDAEYHQTIHRHPVVGGYYGRTPQDLAEKANDLITLARTGDIIGPPGAWANALGKLGVKYIVVRRPYADPGEVKNTVAHLTHSLGAPTYQDEQMFVFIVPDSLRGTPLETHNVALEGDWYAPELWDGVSTRWMGKDAIVKVTPPQGVTRARLTFKAYPFRVPHRLGVLVNNQVVAGVMVSMEGLQSVESEPFLLNPGENIIRLHSVEPCEVPLAVGLGMDSRCLAFAIQELRLLPTER
jgi:hypothetical protein